MGDGTESRGSSPTDSDDGATGRSGEDVGLPRGTRDELRARAQQRKADLERQFEARRAQLDATNERITARTGRNLIFAIGIGLALGGGLVVSLVVVKELFMVFAGLIVVFASLELATALRHGGHHVPRIPTVLASVAIIPSAFYLGIDGAWISFLIGCGFVTLWRMVEYAIGFGRTTVRSLGTDLGLGIFVQAYVSFLGSFAILLLARPDGQWWTLAFLIVVVSVDVGAYASGLTWGKHPMAPRISPKKTWEGFAGAAVIAVLAAILLSIFMLDQPWWLGVILGVALVLTATMGDLAESLIKRDIGIKDMSSWLPGHGGFLDRLDSILPSAAVAYAIAFFFA